MILYAPQLQRLHDLVAAATHPRTDPMGRQYPDGTEWAQPRVYVGRWHDASSDCPGCVDFALEVPGDVLVVRDGAVIDARSRLINLAVGEAGQLWVWSYVRVPAELCDCECGKPQPFSGEPTPRERCPRHGKATREIEVARVVPKIGWEIVDRAEPRWLFVVREGAPFRDVLAGLREEHAEVAA